MKIKNIVVSVILFIAVASVFGYRYWYVPNFVMPKTVSVVVSPQPKPQIKKTVTVTKKSEPIVKAKNKAIPSAVPVQIMDKNKIYKNLIKNNVFKNEKDRWQPWQHAKKQSENIKIVNVKNNINFDSALRIENPNAVLIGMQQLASLKSGTVYRLSGFVRSPLNHDDGKIFGGRLALFLPPQKEKQIVWMSKSNKWLEKELIFTNQVSGTAVVYVHMGYGGVACTGEFTNIKLEKLEN